MKNLKVSLKLIISFLIVVVMAVLVGVVGIVGMLQISQADRGLYEGNYLPTVMAGNISQGIVEQRVHARNFVIFDVVADAADFKSAETGFEESKKNMQSLFAEYDPTIVSQADGNAFDEFVKVYNNEWIPTVERIQEYGRNNLVEAAKDELVAASEVAGRLDDLTTLLQEINMGDGEATVNGNGALFTRMTVIEIVVLGIAVATALILAFYISGLISKPASFMKDILLRIGTKGDLNFTDAEFRKIEEYATAKDEIGESVDMLLTTVRRLVNVGGALEHVADGDLTTELALLSNTDSMGISLKKMVDNLNRMFGEISASTSQVSIGSTQIADGAQALAQGSTEQAAAVQQLSSSISEIAQKTKVNADMAIRAANLGSTIKQNAEKGSTQMDQMTDAVREINEASQSINKVIKVIDDIAFQTNILALNAAVEAARAGQHGKGFAVVAEEVRNLAAKSAEAAKDTGGLIANSMEKAELGARIAGETASSLAEIVSGINESSQIVEDIAKSSEEQSQGISQINKGIDQVAQVIQQNSATAEESAASSEEMSGQASMLESLVSQFKLRGDKNTVVRQAIPSAPAAPASRQEAHPVALNSSNSGGFGKY